MNLICCVALFGVCQPTLILSSMEDTERSYWCGILDGEQMMTVTFPKKKKIHECNNTIICIIIKTKH